MQKKYLKLIGILIIVAIIIVGVLFVYQFYAVNKNNTQSVINNVLQHQEQHQVSINNQQLAPATKTENKQPADKISDWETFKDGYGFQMDYLADKSLMGTPTSKIVDCNNACPSEIVVNGIASSYANQIINGVDYCVYSGAKASAKTFYNEYLFLVMKNNICYGLDVSYSYINCKNTTDGTAEKNCKSKESGDQDLINKSLSTIKFTK
jgi:type II secretory pathway pseudopilin PulG